MGWVTGYPVRVGLTRKNSDWVDQPIFALGKKNFKKKKNRVRVKSGQKIMTRIAMSSSIYKNQLFTDCKIICKHTLGWNKFFELKVVK